ncbi:ABC transporter permease [Roseiterribacter gracilis]|uniref:ABC-2 type transporter transmembrane domain-containing protein n=1 Tax=Roseiterribacter gracilis TaxID=2812848 RepID=A0A8S8XDL1_9PROT|nr:hypothetical protein TMPK1_21060 [Rhodospirillales bacterium TMPK1]
MKRVLIIAQQEFRQFALTRGFWIALLMMPMLALAGATVPLVLSKQRATDPYVIVDQQGGWAEIVEAGFERSWQREQLRALAEYAQRWTDSTRMPAALPSAGNSAAEQLAVDAALRELQPYLKAGAPRFEPPRRTFERVALPADIDANTEATRIGTALGPWLRGERRIETSGGPRRLAAAIVIPRGFSAAPGAPAIQIWNVNVTDDRIASAVRSAISDALQAQAWQAHGITATEVNNIRAITAPMQNFDPGKSGDEKRVSMADTLARIFLPILLGFCLFLSIQTVSGRLLTSTIEERSSKLLDTLLSSVTPNELLLGKLLGMGSAGLLMMTCWIGALIVAILVDPSFARGAGAIALQAIVHSPLLLGAVLYYLLGFSLYASLFLAVGCTARSMQEAQSLLFPIVMVTMVPFFTVQPVLQDPNGPIAVALTWIPLYTPYLMILRSAASPPLFQVIGATLLCLVFTALLIASLGRIFRWSLMGIEGRPNLRRMIGAALRPDTAQ